MLLIFIASKEHIFQVYDQSFGGIIGIIGNPISLNDLYIKADNYIN
jgi:hypothetical protein